MPTFKRQLIFSFMSLCLVVLVLPLGITPGASAHQPKHHHALATETQAGERIILMRHAEKPDDPSNPNLTAAGFQRAQELVPFILRQYGKPDFIFAAADSKKSSRPFETATPLSQSTGVPVDASFKDKDFKDLANVLVNDPRFQGRLIVVVWHHGNIPDFCHALEAKAGSYPEDWKSSTYNQIIQFDYGGHYHPAVTTVVEPF